MDDNLKSRRRWYQFSLRGMLLSTACFASTFGLLAWMLRFEWTLGDIGTLLLCYWWMGASVGAGIGSLFGRFWIGFLIGAAFVLPGVYAWDYFF